MTGDRQHDATTEFNEALAASFAANNFDALGPFYTEDASLLPPRGRILDGRAAASAFWSSVANRFRAVTFTTATLKDLGDAARRETGTYVMGGESQAAEGKYVFVWQLVEGEWQIESAIWNRNGDTGGRNQRQGQGQGQGQQRPLAGRGAGPGGGYRRGGEGQGPGGGYRQGGGRPSFQGGGGAAGGRRPGGGRQGGGYGGGGPGGSALYDGNAGLYSNPKE